MAVTRTFGVWFLVATGAARAQEPTTALPEGREQLAPPTAAALVELLPKLERVIVTPRSSPPIAIDAPPELVRWMEAVRASCAQQAQAGHATVPAADVDLLIHGNRWVRLRVNVSSTRLPGVLNCADAFRALDLSPALEQLVRAACLESARRTRVANGIAIDAEDLRRMPATASELSCMGLRGDDVAAQLPRFARLQTFGYTLGLEPAWTLRAGLPRVLRAVGGLATVRKLSLDATLLTEACVEPLTAIAGVEELTFMVARRTASRESLPRQEILSALSSVDDGARLAVIAEALPRLPHLRVLRLYNCIGTRPVVEALVRTHAVELHVEYSLVAFDDLRRLGELGSLRALTIDCSTLTGGADADLVAALAGLHQLRRLTMLCPTDVAVPLDALRRALPECAVAVTALSASQFPFSLSR